MRLALKLSLILLAFCAAFPLDAQNDRHEVRSGNRKFRKDNFREAEIDYRRAVVKDSLSMAGEYNLASTLYREQDYEAARKALAAVKDVAPSSAYASDYHYNNGDVALQVKDYAAAVEAFKQSLLLNPGDLEAKENYIYAKKMLENQQNQQDQNNQDQNQDQQNQDQNQDQQDQNQNQDQQDQNQDQQNQDNRDDQSQPQPQDQKISPQQAQQMLKAIQAKEKETQDKVNKEKAAVLQSKQKEKNW